MTNCHRTGNGITLDKVIRSRRFDSDDEEVGQPRRRSARRPGGCYQDPRDEEPKTKGKKLVDMPTQMEKMRKRNDHGTYNRPELFRI
ncbi:hypothetical protein MMC24_004980 [Lignoscripta atroalba]|nr:hypothetical protein [Lignoscripta atroalba]